MIHRFAFSRRGALLSVLGCLAAVGSALPATAAAKVTSVTSCQQITAAGTYRLDADITIRSINNPGYCFLISADDVTFNLNGHTISGRSRFLSGFAIAVGGNSAKIVGPGTLTAWGVGVGFFGDGGSVRGVTATGNNVGIEIVNGALDGVVGFSDYVGTNNDVRGNVITGNGRVGIQVDAGATGNTIIGNFAHNNFEDLRDQNPNCDSNVWWGNDFGTADPPSCIH